MTLPPEEGKELNWDDRIEKPEEGGFKVFPDAIYPFTVIGFDRARYAGGDNIPACPMAKVKLEFDGGPTLGTTTVIHRLYLHTNVQGLLAQFFKGLGLRKTGEPLVLNWQAITGKKGYAKLGKRKYNDEWYPDVKRFIPPEKWPTTSPSQVAQQPAPPSMPAGPAQPAAPAQPAQPQPPSTPDAF